MYIVPGFHLEWSPEDCSSKGFDYMNFDFRTFTSTWLSVAAKDVR